MEVVVVKGFFSCYWELLPNKFEPDIFFKTVGDYALSDSSLF